MARKEKPVITPNKAHARLAVWLRAARDRLGVDYRELAKRTSYHATTLQRAAAGKKVPRLAVVEAYALACYAPVEEARKLWRAARDAELRLRQQTSLALATVPRCDLVHNAADLRAALHGLYYRSGALSLREMERRAGIGRLPHSTVHRMLHGAGILRKDQLTAFLTVCGVAPADHGPWLDAWDRVWRRSLLIDKPTEVVDRTYRYRKTDLLRAPFPAPSSKRRRPPTERTVSPQPLPGQGVLFERRVSPSP